MDRDIIAFPVDIVHILDMMDVSGELPGAVHGNVGIIAVDLHIQIDCRVGHENADGSQADDAELLSFELAAGKMLFLLLGPFSKVLAILFTLDPGDTADDISRSQEQAGQNQLFHAVGIGSRGVEDHDALLRAFFQGNVIDASSGSRHGLQHRRKFHLMHGSAADHDRVGFPDIFCFLKIRSEKARAFLGNRIQAGIFKHHAFSSSNFFIKATRASTPSSGMAL